MKNPHEVTQIEYRVREVRRFIVTKFETRVTEKDHPAGPMTMSGSTNIGEHASADMAYEIAYALCKADHDTLGWDIADPRIKYPTGDARYEAVEIMPASVPAGAKLCTCPK